MRLILIFVTWLLAIDRGILEFIRPAPNQMFNIDNSEGLKFLARIRLGLIHLPDYKFRHNFQDCMNHMKLQPEK